MPLVAALLGLSTEGRYPLPEMSPQRQKQRTFEVLIDQLAGLAAQQPVLASDDAGKTWAPLGSATD